MHRNTYEVRDLNFSHHRWTISCDCWMCNERDRTTFTAQYFLERSSALHIALYAICCILWPLVAERGCAHWNNPDPGHKEIAGTFRYIWEGLFAMEKAVFPVYRYMWEDFSLMFNENWCFQLVFCFYIPPVVPEEVFKYCTVNMFAN